MTQAVMRRPGKITFSPTGGFHQTLKRRVNDHFEKRGVAKTGDRRLFLKTGIILGSVVLSYTFLVFLASSPAGFVIGTVWLAQSLALVGLNIQHDANHGAYSRNKVVNWVMSFTIDLIGGSHFLWRQKHNILHHTYTNIDELDDDLHTSGLLRLSPEQPRRFWHRFQHWYAFPVYSLLTLSWVTYGDFKKLILGRIGEYEMTRPRPSDIAILLGMKGVYFFLAVGLPLFFHSALLVLTVLIGIHLIMGLTLAVVFQLAHTVEGNHFPTPDPETLKIQNEWAIHEIETTADFARGNGLVCWYLGGLNFQIEHHLFPRISHVHYPELSKIVEATCREFGVSYTAFPTVWSAIRAHYRHLRKMSILPSRVPALPGS